MFRFRAGLSTVLVALCCIAVAQVAAEQALAAFPGPNGRIAYMSRGSDGIFTVKPDGRKVRRLTAGGGTPAWSPDGSRIAFVTDDLEIATMNARGNRVRKLVDRAFSPAWSPDGSRIVFARGKRGADLFVMNADGTGVTRLTDGEARKSEPAWSPDGSRIAYVRSNRSGRQEIYSMRADGSDRHALTHTPGRQEWSPDFSPDGRTIVYSGEKSSRHRRTEYIYKIHADGSQRKQLTRTPGFGDSDPAFSPNGKKIVYCHSGTNDVIYRMLAGGGHKHLLLDRSASSPDWRPRG